MLITIVLTIAVAAIIGVGDTSLALHTGCGLFAVLLGIIGVILAPDGSRSSVDVFGDSLHDCIVLV